MLKISEHAEEAALLLCPFCGMAADVEESEDMFGGVRKSAGCMTEGCQGYQSNITFTTRREAIAAWNTRAIDAATAEKDAHLDLMVDEFTRISNIANAITGHESKREIEANASEIVALCQRAKETTKQRVPVIVQRDEAIASGYEKDKRIAELEAELCHTEIQHGTCTICGFVAWNETKTERNIQECYVCQLRQRIEAMQLAVSKLTEVHEEADSEMAAKDQRIAELEEKRIADREQADVIIAGQNKRIAELEAKCDNLQTDIEGLCHMRAQENEVLKQCKARIEDLERLEPL